MVDIRFCRCCILFPPEVSRLTTDCQPDIQELQQKIAQLEARIRLLRVSRRVLLNLLRQVDLERRSEVSRLQRELERLRARNRRYARRLWEYTLHGTRQAASEG